MMIAVLNNLPELVLGVAWSGLCFYAGRRFMAWRLKK